MRLLRVASVIPSRPKPGNRTTRVYSLGMVSTAIQLSGGGGAWARKGSCGALLRWFPDGGGARMVGGAGGGIWRLGFDGGGESIRSANGAGEYSDADAPMRGAPREGV